MLTDNDIIFNVRDATNVGKTERTKTHLRSNLPDHLKNNIKDDLKDGTANAENFSLADFIQSTEATLMGRVVPFSRYYQQNLATGKALYCREIMGPCEHRSQIRNQRTGKIREMVMLGSNNYLGLTTHPKIREAAINSIQNFGSGMGGPPLLNGMSSLHRKLERRLVELKCGSHVQHSDYDAMIFASGYQANLGWVTGLMRKGDVLLCDELSHASVYDGIAMAGTNVQAFRFRHNNTEHLEKLLKRSSQKGGRQIFVTVEGVYSMDGDIAPLDKIAALCSQYQATLVIDDAHGVGVLGKNGGGIAEYYSLQGNVDISVGTFSKTFGATGGFIVAKKEVIDYLRFFSRSYMFSAHLPPSTVASVLACLDVLEQEPQLIKKLHENANYLRAGLHSQGFNIQNETAILPILIPEKFDVREINKRLDDEGIFLNSIEYPAVPRHLQRLRASVMATHTREDLDLTISAFGKVKRELKL